MRMAMVDPAGVVVGFLAGNIAENWPLQPGFTLQPDEGCSIGDVWVGAPSFSPGGAVVSTVSNRVELAAQARLALTTNAAYLAISSPTLAQVTAQVNLLTQQNSGLIRLGGGSSDVPTANPRKG